MPLQAAVAALDEGVIPDTGCCFDGKVEGILKDWLKDVIGGVWSYAADTEAIPHSLGNLNPGDALLDEDAVHKTFIQGCLAGLEALGEEELKDQLKDVSDVAGLLGDLIAAGKLEVPCFAKKAP